MKYTPGVKYKTPGVYFIFQTYIPVFVSLIPNPDKT